MGLLSCFFFFSPYSYFFKAVSRRSTLGLHSLMISQWLVKDYTQAPEPVKLPPLYLWAEEWIQSWGRFLSQLLFSTRSFQNFPVHEHNSQSDRDVGSVYLVPLWLSYFQVFLLNFWVLYGSAAHPKQCEASSKQGCGLSHLFHSTFTTSTENSAEHGTLALLSKPRAPAMIRLVFRASHTLGALPLPSLEVGGPLWARPPQTPIVLTRISRIFLRINIFQCVILYLTNVQSPEMALNNFVQYNIIFDEICQPLHSAIAGNLTSCCF